MKPKKEVPPFMRCKGAQLIGLVQIGLCRQNNFSTQHDYEDRYRTECDWRIIVTTTEIGRGAGAEVQRNSSHLNFIFGAIAWIVNKQNTMLLSKFLELTIYSRSEIFRKRNRMELKSD